MDEVIENLRHLSSSNLAENFLQTKVAIASAVLGTRMFLECYDNHLKELYKMLSNVILEWEKPLVR